MPRISWATLSVAVMLATLPLQRAQALTVAEQLALDKPVQQIAPEYEVVSAGKVLYEHCAAEYQVDAAKKAYNDARFNELSVQYMEAFKNAYVNRTTKLPPTSVVEEYRNLIAGRQEAATMNMLRSIESRGCVHATVTPVDTYLEQKRQYELEQQRSH